jgi:hypothetical protein
MVKCILAGFVICSLTSCSVLKQTTNTAKSLPIYGAGVIQKPVITNLRVNPQKISSSYSANAGKGIDYHKSQAIAKAMLENKADIIIEPSFDITTSSSRVSIIVTGYAANYEQFRQMSGADTSLLVDVGLQAYNNGPGDTPAPPAIKRKGAVGLVIISLLVAGALTAGSAL